MQPVPNAGALSPWEPGIFSLMIYGILVLGLTAALLLLASWLGKSDPVLRNQEPTSVELSRPGRHDSVIRCRSIWSQSSS